MNAPPLTKNSTIDVNMDPPETNQNPDKLNMNDANQRDVSDVDCVAFAAPIVVGATYTVDADGPVVIDADAINAFNADVNTLARLLRGRPAVLTPDYRAMLKAHGVSHVYHYLYAMPTLEQQHDTLAGQLSAPFIVLRLLTPRDKKYHDAVKAYQPYDKLVRPLPDMRESAVRLVNQAVSEQRRVYVLINNRTEGHAPGTAKALYTRLVEPAAPA